MQTVKWSFLKSLPSGRRLNPNRKNLFACWQKTKPKSKNTHVRVDKAWEKEGEGVWLEQRLCEWRSESRELVSGMENTYCWLCWWQCNCLPFLRPGWQCWPHWPSAGPGRGGPLRGMMGTNCPWRHHHETEQHPLLSRTQGDSIRQETQVRVTHSDKSKGLGGGRVGEGVTAAAETCDSRRHGFRGHVWPKGDHTEA